MRATIIYDNTQFRNDLQADWGFAALIEAHGKTILFDTGASGSILLANMEKLGINPATVDDVFISHAHFDHTGGLSAFLDQNKAVSVWVPHSFRGVRNAKSVFEIKTPRKLFEGLYTTGELHGIEQALCVETSKGIVVIAGCSHPPMQHLIRAASEFGNVYGIIGGLHGNGPETLKAFDLICATHCTQHIKAIAALYPDRFITGGTGKIIAIEDRWGPD